MSWSRARRRLTGSADLSDVLSAERAAAADGNVARIGVVIPSVNTVVEPLFAAALSGRLDVHAARMPIGIDVTPEALADMDTHGVECAAVLATCEPDAILYGCSASTLLRGHDYDRDLKEQLEARTGVPCATATDAVVRALRAVGASSLCIASPYPAAIDAAEVSFLEQAGFEVRNVASLEITRGTEIARVGGERIAVLARAAGSVGSDALLISCLNFRSHLVAHALEAELDRPVITATTASLWRMLQLTGHDCALPSALVPLVGGGR